MGFVDVFVTVTNDSFVFGFFFCTFENEMNLSCFLTHVVMFSTQKHAKESF